MSRSLGEKVKSAFQRTRSRPDSDSGDNQQTLSLQPDASPSPYLPQHRPRPLTPPDTKPLVAQNGPLFSNLPAEIRREILLVAFGGRTVHMNLIHEYPIVGGINQRGAVGGMRVDLTSPKRWTWSGCLCQRNHHPASSVRPEEWTGHWTGPWADKCLEARVKHSLEPRSQWPLKYQIGVMGWLLCCRQAYLEGIEILYRTNMFHIQGRVLISGIDRLLLPQRLASISFLELNLKAGRDNDEGEPTMHGVASDTLSALENILESMPGLKRVFLSIKSERALAGAFYPRIYNGILNSVDAFCQKQLSSNVILEVPLTLALPSATVGSIKDQAERIGSEVDTSMPFLVWRDLGDTTKSMQLRHSTWPKAPPRLNVNHHSTKDGQGAFGYWIMEGQEQSGYDSARRSQAVLYPAFDLGNS